MLVLTRLAIKSGDIIVSSDITAMNEQLAQLINKYSLLITALTNLVLMPVFAILLRRDDRKRIQLQGFSYTGLNIKNVCLIAVLGMSAAVSVNAIVSLSGLAYFSPEIPAGFADNIFRRYLYGNSIRCYSCTLA